MKSRVAIGMAVLMLFGRPAVQGAELTFAKYEFSFDSTLQDRLFADLNGDGRDDLVLQSAGVRQSSPSTLLFYLQGQDGRLGPDPSWSLALPESAKAFDAGRLSEALEETVVLLMDDGFYRCAVSAGKTVKVLPLMKSKHLLTGASTSRVYHQRFLRDLDGDDVSEIVLPTFNGPDIYRRSGGDYQLLQHVDLPARATFRVGSFGDMSAIEDINQLLRWQDYGKRFVASYTQPDLFFLDMTGDGKLDMVGLLGTRLDVFPQGKDGLLSASDALTFERSTLTRDEKKQHLAGEALTLTDLDGDGIGDIIITKLGSAEQRFSNTRSIYFGRPGPSFGQQPDQVIRSDSIAADFGVFDLNRDGRMDLVIPYIHLAPVSALELVANSIVKVQFRVYLMEASGRYGQDPGKRYARVDRRQVVDFQLNIFDLAREARSLLEGNFTPLVTFGLDVNGDGFYDLVADDGNDNLRIWLGNAKVELSGREDQVIPLESTLAWDFGDLDHNGRSDIVTYRRYDVEPGEVAKNRAAREDGAAGEDDEAVKAGVAGEDKEARSRVSTGGAEKASGAMGGLDPYSLVDSAVGTGLEKTRVTVLMFR